MDRLAGAPFDIVNPNGLAFVILTIIPFLLVFFRENTLWKIIGLTVGPACLYALYLTGSRSGILGLVFIFVVFLYQSEKKIPILIALVIGGLFAVSHMQGDFKDRYLSIFSSDTKNAATAQGRLNGFLADFKVGMHKPIFGHGLGTSLEANTHYGGEYQISHCIYTETFQEIGLIGLVMFLRYVWSVLKYQSNNIRNNSNNYIVKLSKVVFILSLLNIYFGLASYGLSSYEWYFLGGLSVVINEYLRECAYEKENPPDCEVAGRGHQDIYPLRLS
jgi:putative inorganic carbon (HCO3(-)) transporter